MISLISTEAKLMLPLLEMRQMKFLVIFSCIVCCFNIFELGLEAIQDDFTHFD